MYIIVNDSRDEYPISYDEALKLLPGTILKSVSGDYIVVTRASPPPSSERNILVGLFSMPTVITPESGYKSFQITNFNTFVLKTT
jgi:hypothetical protein